MSVSNAVFVAALGIFFNYLVVYSKNKFFGNIIYISIGGIIMYSGSQQTATADVNIMTMIGAVILIGSIINLIYDLLTK